MVKIIEMRRIMIMMNRMKLFRAMKTKKISIIRKSYKQKKNREDDADDEVGGD